MDRDEIILSDSQLFYVTRSFHDLNFCVFFRQKCSI